MRLIMLLARHALVWWFEKEKRSILSELKRADEFGGDIFCCPSSGDIEQYQRMLDRLAKKADIAQSIRENLEPKLSRLEDQLAAVKTFAI